MQVSQEQVPEQNDTAGQAGAASQASATHERSLLAESSGPHSHSLNSPLDGPMRQNLQVPIPLLASFTLAVICAGSASVAVAQVSHEQPPEHSNTAGQAWAATQGETWKSGTVAACSDILHRPSQLGNPSLHKVSSSVVRNLGSRHPLHLLSVHIQTSTSKLGCCPRWLCWLIG